MPCRGLLFSVYTLFSYFFAALMPGRHLLSAMRQKVPPKKNKHNERGARIQGDCAPLAIPRRRRFAEPIPAFKDRAAPPGFRDAFGDRGYGGLGYVGARGSSWSSTAFGSSIRFFELGPDWLTPQHSSLRAYGFQLRCLSE